MTGNSKPKNKFGMLLKNDFLASSRVISLFYLIEAAALLEFIIGRKIENNTATAIGVILNFAIPFLLVFVSLFFVVYDFNKSLYSQQGYLSYSLPVTSNQLLGSKMIVYGMWMFVSYAVSLLVWAYLASYAEGNENIKMADVLLTMFGLPSLAHIKIYAIYYIILFFVITFSFISIIYLAITAGHMRKFQKSPTMSAVIFFVIIAAIMFYLIYIVDKNIFISFLVYDDGPTKLIVGRQNISNGVSLPMSPVFYLVLQDVALFFLTSYIMYKKVNIR